MTRTATLPPARRPPSAMAAPNAATAIDLVVADMPAMSSDSDIAIR